MIEMTEKHIIVIDVEKTRIGCPYCDEWEPFFGTTMDARDYCNILLKDHLRRFEK
jgi:hypothetical protein